MNTMLQNLSGHLQSASFAAFVLDVLFKSFVVLALAGGVCSLWRGASAGTRHLIWFLAVVSLPLLPLLNSTRPDWRKPAWSISTTSLAGNQISLALELAPQASAAHLPAAGADRGSSRVAGIPGAGHAMAAQFNAHWILWLSAVWLAGAGVVLLRFAGGHFYRRKFSRLAQPLQDEHWTGLLGDSCKTLRLRRAVTLLQSAEEVMPMTWGWWRPVILLPAEAAEWAEERRRIVLLHELAHVKRRDYLTQIIAQVVCALYWFNPLVWLAARQMCAEREGACDDLVLGGGCKASDYASHLVEIAGSFGRVPQMAAIAMARSSQLAGRITAIVDASRNRRLRSAPAIVILALIGGIAICLGGSGTSAGGSAKENDPLRQQQMTRLEEFSKQKEKQSELLAAAAGENISPEFQKYFQAAIQGDWQTVTNMYEGFKQRHPQYGHPDQHSDLSLRTSYWGPVLEICLAYDHVTRCEPTYTQMAVDDIISSIPAGSIYFGGTDPGRGLPTAFCKSQVDADPFYTLTQNALADGTYLEYLEKTSGKERRLLAQLAEACRTDHEMQNTNDGVETQKLRAEIAATIIEINEMRTNNALGSVMQESLLSDRERKLKIQSDNLNYFIDMLREARENRVKQLLGEVQARAGAEESSSGDKMIYIPTAEDARRCFAEYSADAQKRLENHQLKPGEEVKVADGRTEISGQVAVMQINGLLTKLIFDKNPGHEFYIEESFPLDWMLPYLEPHGLIMKINRDPLPEISDAVVRQDREFWQSRVTQMIGAWLNERTPLSEVIAFDEKVYLRRDLAGFAGDPRFVENDYACKSFSKWRSSIAGLYAWRAAGATAADEKKRMAEAADLAFRQALALCPYSPEAGYRYATFLYQQQRPADGKLVMAMIEHFKSVTTGASASPKPSVFQVRLALDVPTDATEPMRVVSKAGSERDEPPLYVTKAVLMDHTALKSAQLSKDSLGNPRIDIALNKAGAKQFATVTREHLHQRLAIVIDGKLWTAPVVAAEITGGKAQISGNFSEPEAKDLVAKINESIVR